MSAIEAAARAIAEAEALVITAGAGMGVDSGLPDFRGNEGFWRAYPPFRKLGLSFASLANPRWFRTDPTLAWGFYGHRLHLYRATEPHDGFAILKRWGERKPSFVFTSNVDGQFERAGFSPDAIVECHGSIHHLQCAEPCTDDIDPADAIAVDLDLASMRARGDLPTCPRCGGVARPNILMFGDGAFVAHRTSAQEARLHDFLVDVRRRRARLTVIEHGAGTAIPTVRGLGEDLAARFGATLVRVNVREPDGPDGTIGLAMGARDALVAIDAAIADAS